MFEDSTFESAGRIKTRSRRWMVATLALNGSILLALVLLPLIYPEALHRVGPMILMEAPKPPAEVPKPVKLPEQRFHGQPEMSGTRIFAPPRIPDLIPKFNGPEGPPPSSTVADLGDPSGVPGGVDQAFHGHESAPVVHSAPKGPTSVSSGVMTGQLIYKVTPTYPPIAAAMRAEGTVVLQAIISKAGTIENLRVVSGPSVLQGAALDAVKQWRYRPYQLDGQAVEVETTINVVFTLGR